MWGDGRDRFTSGACRRLLSVMGIACNAVAMAWLSALFIQLVGEHGIQLCHYQLAVASSNFVGP